MTRSRTYRRNIFSVILGALTAAALFFGVIQPSHLLIILGAVLVVVVPPELFLG